MSNENRAKSPWVWVLGGTGAALLMATILFQMFRANQGTADEASRSAGTSAKARINSTDTPPAQAAPKGQVAGRVTREGLSLDISREEVAQECMNRVGKEVLESMINRSIIQLACKQEKIEVTAAEVDQEIVRIATEFRIPVEQYLQSLQAERGISVSQYRKDVIWPMLALKKLAGNEVSVSEKEIQQAFEREYGERVKARMILCDNVRRAQVAWQRVKEDPQNFEKYVQEFSVDPGSKSLDGSIPPIPRHSGSPNLEKAAFKLKPEEISGIVQLDDAVSRFVILKCEGRTVPVVTQLDDQVQAELEDQIRKQKTQEQVAKVFESIKKNTRIDNYIAGTTTAGAKPPAGTKTGSSGRPDDLKSSGTKTGTKSAANGSGEGSVRQAGGQGTSSNRVKQAVASEEDDLDLPVQKKPNSPTRR